MCSGALLPMVSRTRLNCVLSGVGVVLTVLAAVRVLLGVLLDVRDAEAEMEGAAPLDTVADALDVPLLDRDVEGVMDGVAEREGSTHRVPAWGWALQLTEKVTA